jgi:hypothetical protein
MYWREPVESPARKSAANARERLAYLLAPQTREAPEKFVLSKAIGMATSKAALGLAASAVIGTAEAAQAEQCKIVVEADSTGWHWMWCYTALIFGCFIGREIHKVEVRLRLPRTQDVHSQSEERVGSDAQTQSQCTYTRWTSKPRFHFLGNT